MPRRPVTEDMQLPMVRRREVNKVQEEKICLSDLIVVGEGKERVIILTTLIFE